MIYNLRLRVRYILRGFNGCLILYIYIRLGVWCRCKDCLVFFGASVFVLAYVHVHLFREFNVIRNRWHKFKKLCKSFINWLFFNVIATGGRHKILDKAFKIPNMKNLCSSLMSNLETFLRFFLILKLQIKSFKSRK